MMLEKIAFVGVGRMGANMARRLKECGYPIVSVYDVHTESAQALARELETVVAATLAAGSKNHAVTGRRTNYEHARSFSIL